MKYLHASTLFAVLALLASGALAQKAMGDMGNMDMSNMGKMGNMENMGNMTMGKKPQPDAKGAHKASGTVKKLDQKNGVVTLSHGPVATLNWPAMTMGFKVLDQALLPKLTEGKKVDVEFVKQGDDYVVTSVK